jgi:DNA topoisomerase-1
MNLVIVESPSKAKIINKYLGKDYNVLASFGHIRQLPSKKGSVEPDKNFEMHFEIPPASNKHVKEITLAAKNAKSIILATDPDREGESISWHVVEVLREKKIISKDIPIQRIAFSEISKKSISEAIKNPRTIDFGLVDAQKARQALDYLVGFTLSPLLWKRLPSCKSAGRVQSVALRLICERQEEIDKFISEEFWDISLGFLSENKEEFKSRLTHIDGEKLEKFSIKDSEKANKIASDIKLNDFKILSMEKKRQRRNPYPPFITSTLQQEGSRKLGFTAKKTMQIAQKLYEGISIDGDITSLITYMRTDGVTLSPDAINETREYIDKNLGTKYLPKDPNIYISKSKNAQEAHEAIRPVNIHITPKELEGKIDKDYHKLYDLIWKRTVACQMTPVEIDIVVANISSLNSKYLARSTGSTIAFDGFYKVYKENSDDQNDENHNMLPSLKDDEKLELLSSDPAQHFTEPPPRYGEASLIKKLEELGIGRPSTYTSLISVIQDRNYVKLEKKRFYPDDRGRILSAFLTSYFSKYVEYNFTASLEDDLDKVASNEMGWKDLLKNFWEDFNKTIEITGQCDSRSIIDSVEKSLEYHLFPKQENNVDSRKCPSCSSGTLGLKLGKFGAFLACSTYPDCKYTKQIIDQEEVGKEENDEDKAKSDNIVLGHENEMEITLRKGPYGPYVQKGEQSGKVKPKRVSIPPFLKDAEIDIILATKLLSLPISLGNNPETGKEIKIGIGKFGPYLHYDEKFTSIPKNYSPFDLDIKTALEIIIKKQKK